ncbi:MAG: hypothetical protein QM683_01755 [Lacrimispora sp.]
MKINTLLEDLIEIAQKPKTDFALSMHMTPSGLSKILTGKRLPLMKERKEFTNRAADYFADAIYCPGCYLKLRDIFPVLYDFKNEEEFRAFLMSAVEYALDDAFAAENKVDIDRVERGVYYLGQKSILNIMCILFSDYVIAQGDVPLELYSSMAMFHPGYASMFRRIRVLAPGKCKNVAFNLFFEEADLKSSGENQGIDFFSFITKTLDLFDLSLWKSENDMGQLFVLLKGKLLLLFNRWVDGSLILMPVTNKGYLVIFYNSLMKKGAEKISYSRDEAAAYLEAHPMFVPRLLEKGVDIVYNFVSIGYLLERKELDAKTASPGLQDAVWKLLNGTLTMNKIFAVSFDAMERFISSGNIIVPLLGIVNYPTDARVPYLQRYNSYLREEVYEKVKLIKSELANVAVLCTDGLTLIYTIDRQLERERIHVLKTDRISSMLYEKVMKNKMETVDFTPELWDAYQEGLSGKKL